MHYMLHALVYNGKAYLLSENRKRFIGNWLSSVNRVLITAWCMLCLRNRTIFVLQNRPSFHLNNILITNLISNTMFLKQCVMQITVRVTISKLILSNHEKNWCSQSNTYFNQMVSHFLFIHNINVLYILQNKWKVRFWRGVVMFLD